MRRPREQTRRKEAADLVNEFLIQASKALGRRRLMSHVERRGKTANLLLLRDPGTTSRP